MSQYFLESVGREFFFGGGGGYVGKSMKIVQNTLKIEENFSDVLKKISVGRKKVGLVVVLCQLLPAIENLSP